MGGVRYERERFGVGGYLETATNTSGENAYGGNYRMGWLYGNMSFLNRRLQADLRLSFTTIQSDGSTTSTRAASRIPRRASSRASV